MTAKQCVNCGSLNVLERKVPFDVEHGLKKTTILDRQTFCDECGNISYFGSQISEHQKAVAAAIREMDGLLSGEALARIRARYRLKQTDMEQMLSTGPKTWTRWERGKVPQSKATDKLIRLMAEDPDVARRLMEQAGIDNPEAAETFAQLEESAKALARAMVRAEIRRMQANDMDRVADQVADRAFEAARDARRKAAAIAEAA
jgi:putative zinc finger/helix-turn-helix YgiT family protein